MLVRIATVIVLLCAGVCAQAPQAGMAQSHAALVAEWRSAPILEGNHLRGSLVVINQSDDDFDQTVLIEAVNEIGKAFTLGYQHFTLRSHSRSATIQFDTTLPPGHYQVHADAVAEIAKRNQIHRTSIRTKDDFVVATL